MESDFHSVLYTIAPNGNQKPDKTMESGFLPNGNQRQKRRYISQSGNQKLMSSYFSPIGKAKPAGKINQGNIIFIKHKTSENHF